MSLISRVSLVGEGRVWGGRLCWLAGDYICWFGMQRLTCGIARAVTAAE